MIVVTLQLTASPVEGFVVVVRVTVPVKPFWLVTVAVNVPVRLPEAKVSAAKFRLKGEPVPLM